MELEHDTHYFTIDKLGQFKIVLHSDKSCYVSNETSEKNENGSYTYKGNGVKINGIEYRINTHLKEQEYKKGFWNHDTSGFSMYRSGVQFPSRDDVTKNAFSLAYNQIRDAMTQWAKLNPEKLKHAAITDKLIKAEKLELEIKENQGKIDELKKEVSILRYEAKELRG